MTEVVFLVDFRGKLTAERYYLAGQSGEFNDDIAAQLVAEGRAEYPKVKPAPKPKTAPAKKPARVTKRRGRTAKK